MYRLAVALAASLLAVTSQPRQPAAAPLVKRVHAPQRVKRTTARPLRRTFKPRSLRGAMGKARARRGAAVRVGNQVYLALDLGGTNFDVAAVAADGRVIARLNDVPTPADGSAADLTGALAAALEGVRDQARAAGFEPVGIGAGMPGQMDFERGIWLSTHKFGRAAGHDLKTPLQARLGLPVVMLNDAAAFAEGVAWQARGGKGFMTGDVLAITLGTGLGANYIIDGRVPVDAEASARNLRELWDFPFDGGNLEDRVSKKTLEDGFRARTGKVRSPREIAELAQRSEVDADVLAARATYDDYGRALGAGLGRAQRTFQRFTPRTIVLGGGIARALPLLGPAAERAFEAEAGYRPEFVAVSESDPDLAVQGAARRAIARFGDPAR